MYLNKFRKAIALISYHRGLRISLLCAVGVWSCWLAFCGWQTALLNLLAHWKVALTMIFGSMVAGGTSMGGGAVAFPVFTKVLHVPPDQAKVFSLAIQSVGMSAASITILAMKPKLDWGFIRWASLGGVLGVVCGSLWFAPILPANGIKFLFTMMASSFGLILLGLPQKKSNRRLVIAHWGKRERLLSLFAGLWGGLVSGLVGTGIDIVSFSILVLLFGICAKTSTQTSVILMAINSMFGIILHGLVIGDFALVRDYWLAAVPVVVVGAPIGALLTSLLQPKTITRILISLITVELISSLVLIPLSTKLIYFSLFWFSLFLAIYYWMYRTPIAGAIANSPNNYSNKFD